MEIFMYKTTQIKMNHDYTVRRAMSHPVTFIVGALQAVQHMQSPSRHKATPYSYSSAPIDAKTCS